MRRLRLLARLLDRQLYHIYAGRFAHAGRLADPIEAVVAGLIDRPPSGDSAAIVQMEQKCLELNETVTLRFAEKAQDLGQVIRYISLERAIQGVQKRAAPESPPNSPRGPSQKL